MAYFSIVIITFNAADQLAQTLTAARPLTDDIVVIDSHSTDHTKEICALHSARYITTDWKGYGATKNFGADQALHKWILSLDSDEVVSAELISSLKTLLPESKHVYSLDRINLLGEKWIRHSGWYPDWKPRFYEKHFVQWNLEPVHEELEIPSNYKIEKLGGKLFHYSYPNKNLHYERMMKYAKLSAEKLYQNGTQYSYIKATFSPMIRFLKTYLIKGGFLDGSEGWLISKSNAKMVRAKYRYLKELINENSK